MAEAAVKGRLIQYALLMRFDKPIGTLLLLWPTLWALWIAGAGQPDPFVTMVFICGVFVMRSAGCVINDLADRALDPHVQRTMHRPIAAGVVSVREALVLLLVLCALALGLVLLMNELTVLLSLAGAALAASYPFMKRYHYVPQVHLGVAFGWAVPMSFAAQTQSVPALAWLLLIAVVLWAVAYDTMYAMVDREDDLYIGVKSTAILFGEADRAFIAGIQASVLLVLFMVGRQAELGLVYYTSLGAGAILFLYQQYLLKDRTPSLCFRAFLNNNWVGAVIFAGLAMDYALR